MMRFRFHNNPPENPPETRRKVPDFPAGYAQKLRKPAGNSGRFRQVFPAGYCSKNTYITYTYITCRKITCRKNIVGLKLKAQVGKTSRDAHAREASA